MDMTNIQASTPSGRASARPPSSLTNINLGATWQAWAPPPAVRSPGMTLNHTASLKILPLVPDSSMTTFEIQPQSSMAGLIRTFTEVGVPVSAGRVTVVSGTPDQRQAEELRLRGINPHTLVHSARPRVKDGPN